jgi:GNAT superfamily N-acetyltransferase
MQRAFLGQQHQAQTRHYRAVFPSAEWLILEHRGRPIGRLLLDRGSEAVRVIDISLLPDWRGKRLGTALLRDLMHGNGNIQASAAEGRSR